MGLVVRSGAVRALVLAGLLVASTGATGHASADPAVAGSGAAVVMPVAGDPPAIEPRYSEEQKYRNDRLRLKLNDAAGLELDQASNFKPREDRPEDRSAANQLNQVLRHHGKLEIDELARQDLVRPTGASNAVADSLDSYYTIRLPEKGDIQAVAEDIAQLEGVEAAYPEAKPAPLPTASYTSLQTYLRASPEGIGADFARTYPGGNGKVVRVIDLEYSWNNTHEDLGKTLWTYVRNGTPEDPFSDNNHGTAVMGELVATDNGFGVTGAVNGIALSRINTFNQERGWDVVGALQLAAQRAVPGDVILVEQQTWAPEAVGGFAPVEWEPAIYDAIKALTDSGVNVIEAAGNSGHNLDDASVFGTSFPMGKPDSGAIIVGAGAACSPPMRSRLWFSNYGKRVELQGHGECVATTGYGSLGDGTGPNGYYTSEFNGTSSAAPVVAAAVASLSSAYETLNPGKVLSPAQVRYVLVLTGTPQDATLGTLPGHIGPLPDLNRALLVADQTPPSAPTGVSITLVGNKPRLTWSAATDNVAIKEYHVYRHGWWVPRVVTTLSFTDASAVGGQSYS